MWHGVNQTSHVQAFSVVGVGQLYPSPPCLILAFSHLVCCLSLPMNDRELSSALVATLFSYYIFILL